MTEFLLARIAEDEASAEDEVVRMEKDPMIPGASYALTILDVITPARVLAECAAKRKIVGSFPTAAQNGDGWDEAGYSVLCIMAAVYGDHPDYREEWTP